jgi:hypothetical protein
LESMCGTGLDEMGRMDLPELNNLNEMWNLDEMWCTSLDGIRAGGLRNGREQPVEPALNRCRPENPIDVGKVLLSWRSH